MAQISTLLTDLRDLLSVGMKGLNIGRSVALAPSLSFARDNVGTDDEMLVMEGTGFSVRVEDRDHETKSILGTRVERIPHFILEAFCAIPATYNDPPDGDVVECAEIPCNKLQEAVEVILTTMVLEGIRNVIALEGEARYWQEQMRRDKAGITEEVWA